MRGYFKSYTSLKCTLIKTNTAGVKAGGMRIFRVAVGEDQKKANEGKYEGAAEMFECVAHTGGKNGGDI